jgi:hypothetical protein
VFLLGHWKDYAELEESLSIHELVVTLNALRAKELRERQFAAAIQGIELGDKSTKPDESFESVWEKAKGEGRPRLTDEQKFKKLGIALESNFDTDD